MQTTTPTSDFRPIYELANQYASTIGNARLVSANPQPIRDWINAGCDIEKDILPVMQAMMAKKRDIFSFSWFTRAVLAAHDIRVQKEQAEANRKPEDIHQKARKLAWMRKYSTWNYTKVAAELEAYERQHGEVRL